MFANIFVKEPNPNQGGRLLSKRGDTAGWEFVAPRHTGVVSFLGQTTANGCKHANIGKTRVDDGRWHSVAVVYDGQDVVYAYVDGKLDVQESFRGHIAPNSAELYAGTWKNFDGHAFEGEFRDLVVYERMLSEAELSCGGQLARLLLLVWLLGPGSAEEAR